MLIVSFGCYPLLAKHDMNQALGVGILEDPGNNLICRTAVANDHDRLALKVDVAPFRSMEDCALEGLHYRQIIEAFGDTQSSQGRHDEGGAPQILAAGYEVNE